MNYELAKELKDAGFRRDGLGEMVWPEMKTNNYTRETPITLPEMSIYSPTLSELIEACGVYLITLLHNPLRRQWLATDVMPGTIVRHSGEGSTPEEAVARLWLALQGKK